MEVLTHCCAWSSGTTIPVRLNAASFDSNSTQQSFYERQTIRAIDEWNLSGADLFLDYQGRTTLYGVQTDFINIYMDTFSQGESPPLARIMCKADGYCDDAADPGPYSCIDNGSGCIDVTVEGHCVNWCDMPAVKFNAEANYTAGYPTTGETDFRGVLTHEMAHALGHVHAFTDDFDCAVMGYQSGPIYPAWDPEQSRYLWRYDIDQHLSDPTYGYGAETGANANSRRAEDLTSFSSFAGPPSGGQSNLRPAIAFSDGTTSDPDAAYCLAIAAASAPYGAVNHVVTVRGDGTSGGWEWGHPNASGRGWTWAITEDGIALSASEDAFMLAWVDNVTSSDELSIHTAMSGDCASWTTYETVEGAYTHVAPALAFDWYRNRFLLVWVDADEGTIKAATRPPTGSWSAVQTIGFGASLSPALSYTFGNLGTLTYARMDGYGQICSSKIYVNADGTVSTSYASCHSSTIFARKGLSGTYGYDEGTSSWRYVLAFQRYDTLGGTQRNVALSKTNPNPWYHFSEVGTISGGTSSMLPRVDASIVYSQMGGTGSFNEFMATYVW